MFYYKLNNDGKITQFSEIPNGYLPPTFMKDWLSTEDKIVRIQDGSFAFEKDVDMEERVNQRQQEAVVDDTPSLEQRINDLELALIELAGGV